MRTIRRPGSGACPADFQQLEDERPDLGDYSIERLLAGMPSASTADERRCRVPDCARVASQPQPTTYGSIVCLWARRSGG
jgi:hypothetical protein